jgi:hypothetical protein
MMKRIAIAALVAAGTLLSAVSCATTDDGSSQGSNAQGRSTRNSSFNYPAY